MDAKKRLRDRDVATGADDSETGSSLPPAKRIPNQNAAGGTGNTQELLSLFTDCMSALSTNKICSRNAFDVGIIDHMTDLVHLDGGSDDEDDMVELPADGGAASRRLNFTRASKVVESASKIYGYRIEAIYDQTFNVLMSMNSAAQAEGGNTTVPVAKTRNKGRIKLDSASGSRTLAPEAEVTLSEIPMDNVVLDPYFLKISSMFDHSGAQGLLLMNLQVTDDLSLDLDGDSLVFAPPRPRSDEDCVVEMSHSAIEEVAFKGLKDSRKLEILPEASYFRTELQRLQDLKRRRQGGETADVDDTTISQTDEDVSSQANELPWMSELALDNLLSDSVLSQPDGNAIEPLTFEAIASNLEGSEPPKTASSRASSGIASSLGIAMPASGRFVGSTENTGRSSVALRQRLREIDLVGGSQFSYYTTNIKKISGGGGDDDGASSLTGNEVVTSSRKGERSSKIKDAVYRDISSYMRIHSIKEELESIGQVSNLQPTKALGRHSAEIFTAPDYTGSVFKFSDNFLTRLGTLGNRILRMVSDQDWRTNPGDNQPAPLLQIYYTTDTEAPYSSLNIEQNFSWKIDDQVGFSHYDEPLYNYQDAVDGKPFEFALDELDSDALHVSVSNDISLSTSIDDMYEPETFDPPLVLSQTVDTGSVIKPIADTAGGVIAPAPVTAYVDIFKIKKTLCSVILPPPDFQEAIEDEKQLKGVKSAPSHTEESSCMFQHAITETLKRLNDSEVAALNSHIMFVCLLHVCNEHDLLLRQTAALEDFKICVGAPKQHHLGNFSRSRSS
ncbi:Condensin complex subunit 2 [Babesia sp. Xinjiang]|uniref:Condensin complex subunit 2 n=1 Tax=Babesia sp. Xinjiang TaxID=462227 RepID=UPI000A218312|nr:Condensin complex subunit 2 [Babesia sp. Xinjiang]ORM40588.1 Condensin complex subunit 2 [Babesia sp. Xinjiang]